MSQRRLRVLAVDDERPALEDLAQMLRTAPEVDDVVLTSGGGEALRVLADQQFDAVFLDVRMPGLDGLELAAVLGRFASPPLVVFVSAYEDGAVGAFELDIHAVDYLMKPVSKARIAQALARVVAGGGAGGGAGVASGDDAGVGSGREAGSLDDGSGLPAGMTDEIIPVEHQRGGATRLVQRSSVLYIKAEGDYVRIVADNGRYLVRAALSDLEHRWQAHGFVRVHRSYVANLRRAVEIRPELGGGATVVLADGSEIPVARRQVADLRRRLRM
jgi:DNA-binding LytR/AlgR family response regulator